MNERLVSWANAGVTAAAVMALAGCGEGKPAPDPIEVVTVKTGAAAHLTAGGNECDHFGDAKHVPIDTREVVQDIGWLGVSDVRSIPGLSDLSWCRINPVSNSDGYVWVKEADTTKE